MNRTLLSLCTLLLLFPLAGCSQNPDPLPTETTGNSLHVPETQPDPIELCGTAYPRDTESLTLHNPDAGELFRLLPQFSAMHQVHLIQPEMKACDLFLLCDTFPQITFTWEKEVLGTVYASDTQEIDLSGIQFSSLTELEQQLEYFPRLQKLILCDCGLDNETLAAFRDRVRSQYKVVWSVQIKTLTVRTDETTFMPVKHDVFIFDDHTKDLIYCEDMIVVDVGHMPIHNIDFVTGMPHLQYLIVADTLIRDISAIQDHKELVYLEIFKLNIDDYTPLLSCTALEDLNLSQTSGDPAVLAQMPWLKNLWMVQCSVSDENRLLLTQSLPDTRIEFDLGWTQGDNWRTLEHYFIMRDLLDMAPNAWW